jgi:aryl-alcohol dehydrogenase-like predicted oxidoreductase
VEHSLRTLKTDHLDLVQFHHSLDRAELEADGALDELLRLRDEGKTRFVGISGTLPKIVELIDMGVFDAFQVPYSAVERAHEDLMAKAAASGIGIIVRGGVARGGPSDWSLARPYDWALRRRPQLQAIWKQAKLDDVLDGMSPMEFILRFTISNEDLDTTIVGTSNLEHLRDNIEAASKGPLPAAVVEEAKRRLDAAGSTPTSLQG